MNKLYEFLVGGNQLKITQTLIGQSWLTHVLSISVGGNKELMVLTWMKLRMGPTRIYMRHERD